MFGPGAPRIYPLTRGRDAETRPAWPPHTHAPVSPAILRLDDLLQEDQEIKESLVQRLTSVSVRLLGFMLRSQASLAPLDFWNLDF